MNEPLSLGKAFASVPNELALDLSPRFRVIVVGREKTLKTPLRDQIYGVVREAIVNAFRHSKAREIEVEIEYGPAMLHIAVRDDGCGIDPQHLQCERNLRRGLLSMRERAEAIGGRLRIMSRIALGTEVQLCVAARIAFAS